MISNFFPKTFLYVTIFLDFRVDWLFYFDNKNHLLNVIILIFDNIRIIMNAFHKISFKIS